MNNPLPDRPSRPFERLVNDDLRDKYSAGPAYAILSRPENLLRWLHTLNEFRESILTQNAHENAILRAHPERASGGATLAGYAEDKRRIEERKRGRQRTLQAVNHRISEVECLIGPDPLSREMRGVIAGRLTEIDALLGNGDIDGAQKILRFLLRRVAGATNDSAQPSASNLR